MGKENGIHNEGIDFEKAFEFLKKYWIFLLGFLIVFLSLIYLVKVAYDAGFFSPEAIIYIGLGAGCAGLISAFLIYRKDNKIFAEICAGFSVSILYATLAYAAVTNLWPYLLVFIVLVVLTTVLSAVNFKLNLRILTVLSFAGGLAVPFVVRASEFQIFFLFLYCFILNGVIIGFSLLKKWRELPIVGFILTSLLYIIYYVNIQPESWGEPFFYILSFFLLYSAGLIILGKLDNNKLSVINMILSFINSGVFAFWAIWLFLDFSMPFYLPFIILGSIFLVSAAAVYFTLPQSKEVSNTYFFAGLGMFFIAGAGVNDIYPVLKGMDHLVRAGIWQAMTILVFVIGTRLKKMFLVNAAANAWLFIFFYWLGAAWGMGTVNWFGVTYLPVINPPALFWLVIIIFGFVISMSYTKYLQGSMTPGQKIAYKWIGHIAGIISHIAVGTLFTFQVTFLWKFYSITSFPLEILLSLVWGLYAFSLFFWGFRNNTSMFMYFADAVLIIVAIKVIFFDLSGESNIITAFVVFLTGIVILGIGFLNVKWQKKIKADKDNQKPVPDKK